MRRIHLLADNDNAFLGEIATNAGAFGSARLTPEGEERIGAELSIWQTMGIPEMRERMETLPDGERWILYEARVQLRDSGFEQALSAWCHRVGIQEIVVTEERMKNWEQLLRLPLYPEERWEWMTNIAICNAETYDQWQRHIAEALKTLEKTI